jgi:hypothetical protein
VRSSPAAWMSASRSRAQHPAASARIPRDREWEYDRLTAEIARLTRSDGRPPAA